ncbi:hypothetical protein BVRB_1g022690 [Beta vulgaris subsp. vulgaris]|uniref:Uncharacterized protein n=1 Tax=Beta vulgaris subsp. vulgaris TaxID=3555 RepID=A0A0J8BE15_BETVV|nr:hypothetical protein BVRB_1g022690 [Beta vulgaris subsp. vulgaris]
MAARVELRQLHGVSSVAAAKNNSSNTDESGNIAKERGEEKGELGVSATSVRVH